MAIFAKKSPRATTTPGQGKPKKLPEFNVILLNDDQHTHAYVIEMLQKLFGHSQEKATELAKEVHEKEKAIVYTTHKERAEFKRDQIKVYGKDPRIAKCKGSMSAIIEPTV